MLNKLRMMAQELKEKDKDKYTLILNILNDDDCYKKMDMDTFYSILDDLGIQNKNKVYLDLMKGK
jgi:hypothetical protein